jgi:superfamily II DNA or RNA helicase
MKATKIENIKGDIIVASHGVLSTGVSIPSIDNIIFASPSKSMIRVLQSIGRGLRLNEGKTVCNLYDLSDNLSTGKGHRNHTLNHFDERIKIYSKEKFNFKLIPVDL